MQEIIMTELRQIGLMFVFGLTGAAATVLTWHVFAAIAMPMVRDDLVELACFSSGLAGPLAVLLVVWFVTRNRIAQARKALRWPAVAGLGVVVAAQLAFYIPLGFLCIAY
jgi:hypothetical protein